MSVPLQKIIKVTTPAGMIERLPPMNSCASNVGVDGPNVSSALKTRAMTTPAAILSHTALTSLVRPVLWTLPMRSVWNLGDFPLQSGVAVTPAHSRIG
ncbi:MAG: hypothetical protein L0I80_11710, partial [Brevibacterium sp.]|nr:hypothetical protein [Brevibacterium sp.]